MRVKDGVYNIPSAIFQFIDFISPTIRFPVERHTLSVQTMDPDHADAVAKHSRDQFKRKHTISHALHLHADSADDDQDDGASSDGALIDDAEGASSDGNRHGASSGEGADGETTANVPARLYELYDMTDSMAMIMGSDDVDSTECRQAVASFIEQYYNDEDIEGFWENLDVYPTSEMQRIPEDQPEGYGSEAELDTQYITVESLCGITCTQCIFVFGEVRTEWRRHDLACDTSD